MTEDKRSLLAIFAHPDDEAFGTGGTLAHYAARGVRVDLVCATRGEAGEIADSSLATLETLAEVRENELRCAAGVLGINEVVFLGYRDSGMAGTPENAHPQALVNIPADQVVPRLVGIIRRLRPQIVITFEPGGGYGHPDHIAIHRHAVAAYHAAADASAYPEQGPAWQAARLYYTAIPRSFFLNMKERMQALGIDTSAFARFDLDVLGWPDEQVHCTIDVSDQIEAKWAAFHCHRTQFGSDSLFRSLPEDLMKQMLGWEWFAQAWPQPPPVQCQGDLFAGLD